MKMMVCYKTLDVSKNLIQEAQKHAQKWQASLDIVTCLTREDPVKHSKLKQMEDQFQAEINTLFDGIDIPHGMQFLVSTLEPGEQLLRFAERKNIDLLFLGIKKKSKVGKLLFGSTTQHVILNAACPVVVTKS